MEEGRTSFCPYEGSDEESAGGGGAAAGSRLRVSAASSSLTYFTAHCLYINFWEYKLGGKHQPVNLGSLTFKAVTADTYTSQSG